MSQITTIVILNSIKIIKGIDKMLFKGLRSKFTANKEYCLCTKKLVENVDDMLFDKTIKRDKPCLYTLQRLFAIKQVNNFATTMLEDINNVLSQMIDDTRQPDLVRYNNIIEAKLLEYEKLLDKYIVYKDIDLLDTVQRYADELLLYGEECYKLSEDMSYKICQVIVNDGILNSCSNSTIMAFNSLMVHEHEWLVDVYCKYVTKSNEALNNLVELINKEV